MTKMYVCKIKLILNKLWIFEIHSSRFCFSIRRRLQESSLLRDLSDPLNIIISSIL